MRHKRVIHPQMVGRIFALFRLDRHRASRYTVAVCLRTMPLMVGSAINARVAQLVEQRTENPRVGGSNPPPGTIFSITYYITCFECLKIDTK